jgi:hypothetical protein
MASDSRPYRRRFVARVLGFVVALSSTLPQSPVRAQSTRPTGPLAPSEGTLFGAYVKPTEGWDRDDVEAGILQMETQVGRTLAIDHHFAPWGIRFPSWKEHWDVANGRIPMTSWGAISTRKVNSGAVDGFIRARADEVREFGHPIFIRWFWEMDADASFRRAGRPSRFITAWRRIRWIFAQEGATNAVWVWCPTAWGFYDGSAQRYYPGDQYVDWVCATGFNWAPGRPGDRWRRFREIFDPFYLFGSRNGKPMMVGAYGVQERGAGEKADWFTDASADLKERFPSIAAIVYFNSNRDFDWWVTTSASSVGSFQAMALEPYFNPAHPGLPGPDPSRFDSVLEDGTAPIVEVVAPTSGRYEAGRYLGIRWRTIEAHRDFVRVRYRLWGGTWHAIRRRTADDGVLRWAVPQRLQGRRVRIGVTAFDLARNRGEDRSPWFRLT